MNIAPLSTHSDFTTRRPVSETPVTNSVFPADAQAVIYKAAPSPMTSGRARAQRWTLRFERRSAPYIEPLMGWTGDDDPLSQVKLSFPSAAAAIAYARRQGLQYSVQGLPAQGAKPRLVSDNPEVEGRAASQQRRRRLEWIERTLGPEVIRHGSGPGAEPAESYADPQQVLLDSNLSPARKRDILRRWALHASKIETEHSKGNLLATPSHLQEVIDALLDLEEPQITAASFEHVDRKAS
ncbi:NADH dehydrogenase ubiquinone Fe-S protein 4 [Bradyrhizobium japonicum]|uniref:NADH dehydrogenase ubiquinone Fe-S protein 4 n=1 Tax=Bradyrhizobium japonicum TaxID=375 RepID=UPI0027147B01|nr:NADH dehydrogenase ubiquinone Fe-S protein 4 [Bradyrhizobium japonicum]WLB54757.1 ETC complex I subunit [Bradyrhizobium japonicum]WLB63368.1 ETC complex I subunit [Bradyrhizobium japonicum]